MLGGAAAVYAVIQTIDFLIPLMTIFTQFSPLEAIGRNNLNGKCVCVFVHVSVNMYDIWSDELTSHIYHVFISWEEYFIFLLSLPLGLECSDS